LEDANFIYQYDNNGNLILKTPKISGPITSYEYDAENKLVRVVSNGTTANYKYDGLGRRVEKEIVSASTMVTRYVYDNEDILFELESANNIVARYTHGPGIDEPLIMEKAGAPFFYHSDGLGSITDITNQSGVVVQRYPYSSFGKIESQSDPNFVQPYAFTARELDPEIELYHFRRRAFRPAAGRFLQSDPLDLLFAQTNLYVYVRNNPTSYIDPTGQVLFAPIFKLLGSNLDEAMLQSSIFSTMPSLLHRAGLVEFPCPIEELFGNFEPALTVSEIASGLTLAFRTAPYLAAAGAGNGIIAGYIIPVSTAFLGGLSAGAAINDFVIAPLTGGPTFKESMRILLGPP
jgi:RHS repeat-associated protein